MRRALGLFLASVLLAGCGLTTSHQAATPSYAGTASPSLQIGVPLTTAGCLADDHCLVLGTTGLATAPTSAGQVWANGHWSAIAVPSAPGTQFLSANCGALVCLFSGASATGPVLWRWDGVSVTPATVPKGATAIWGAACSDTTCNLVVANAGTPSFWRSADGGETWGLYPGGLDPQASPTGPLSLACLDSGSATPTCAFTQNGMIGITTGVSDTTPLSFDNLDFGDASEPACATYCFTVQPVHKPVCNTCSKLDTNGGPLVLRQINNAAGWGTFINRARVPASITHLACRHSGCVVLTTAGAIAVQHRHTFTTVTYQYFTGTPSTLSCGRHVCVAASATSVAVLTP